MDATTVVSLGLLVALAVAALLVVRRMTQIASDERMLRSYVEGVSRVVAAADAALDRGTSAVDGLLHGRGATDAAAGEVARAVAEIDDAQSLLASLPVPRALAESNGELSAALASGRVALADLGPDVEGLEPGRPLDDPRRLEAERSARRATLTALRARDDVHVAERRVESSVSEARARTSRRLRRTAG
jgi:hypothetical protein